MASSGRKPLTELEKAKRKAARDYRKIAEKRSLTYDDIYGKRAGEKHMGRKPVPKSEQVRRAKVDFLESLEDYRVAAKNDHIELPVIRVLLRELRAYRADDSAGRKSADRVIILYKYIEKEEAKRATVFYGSCPLETYNGRGRKPMSREEKILHHDKKIEEAKNEIKELVKNVPNSQKIYYDLRKERLTLRKLKQLQKIKPQDETVRINLEVQQGIVNQLEKKYKAQLALEKKSNLTKAVSNSATPVSNLAKALPNSTMAVSSPENSSPVAEVPANLNPHDSIELMKKRQEELNEEMATLDELERVLRQKAQVLKQQRELEEAIAAKQKEALR